MTAGVLNHQMDPSSKKSLYRTLSQLPKISRSKCRKKHIFCRVRVIFPSMSYRLPCLPQIFLCELPQRTILRDWQIVIFSWISVANWRSLTVPAQSTTQSQFGRASTFLQKKYQQSTDMDENMGCSLQTRIFNSCFLRFHRYPAKTTYLQILRHINGLFPA